jgi:diguanylate cyclase (GGDEF)-like protein
LLTASRTRSLALLVLVAAIYFIAGKLGLQLAFNNPSASVVWPPTGIALAALLLLGWRAWPAIFISAFLVNLTTTGTLATSIGIALGNTLEGVIGAYLVNRFAGGRWALLSAENLFRFTILAALVSTALCASWGVTVLALGGFARWGDFGPVWLTWWLGDMTGNLVVAPFLLAWSSWPRPGEQRGRLLEGLALFTCLVLAGEMTFGGLLRTAPASYPMGFLTTPFLVWAAFRFGPRGAATGTLVLSGIAVLGTIQGYGPFAQQSADQSLILLQAYMGVTSVTTLMLAAVVNERREVEQQLRHQSVSDPLTGIGNYRHLIDRLQTEIERSQRTGRPFAVLFIDLNGLKAINDRYGHLTGNKALCRVAGFLGVTSRTIDTPTRFGGDEFALVLPETDEEAAGQVGRRIAELLDGDTESPPLSVSQGVAVFPADGQTAEALLGAADRSLYDTRASERRGRPLGIPDA